jgi:hypothetical protein
MKTSEGAGLFVGSVTQGISKPETVGVTASAKTCRPRTDCDPKPGSHLDNKHYLGGIGSIDELRAFGPQLNR